MPATKARFGRTSIGRNPTNRRCATQLQEQLCAIMDRTIRIVNKVRGCLPNFWKFFGMNLSAKFIERANAAGRLLNC
jgi:hypothetical protein